jgi:hypothetical protein
MHGARKNSCADPTGSHPRVKQMQANSSCRVGGCELRAACKRHDSCQAKGEVPIGIGGDIHDVSVGAGRPAVSRAPAGFEQK